MPRTAKAFLMTAVVFAATALASSDATPATAQVQILPADFQANITHPLFPLSLIGPKVLEGVETDPKTGEKITSRLESRLLPRNEIIMGVIVVVLEEKAYEDGELIEVALDYFAQHRDGSVYYFGEKVDNFENGKLRDHAGQWIAGEGKNLPGIIMPAHPVVGQTYQQEFAPGIAADMATVLSLTDTVSTPVGTFQNCMKTREFTPLEPSLVEFKWHCPGVGLAQEEGPGFVIKLISLVGGVQQRDDNRGSLGGLFGPLQPQATAAQATQPVATAPTIAVQPPRTGDGGLADPDEEFFLAAAAVASALLIPTAIRLIKRNREVR